MNDAELKARKAAVDFVNAHFSDLESLDRVKDIYDDVHKASEASKQQLDEQVSGDGPPPQTQPAVLLLRNCFY